MGQVKPKIYVETTVVSYLAARRSRDLVVAAHQQITEDWWHLRRADFDLFVSQSVVSEASAGDPEASLRRLEVLDSLPLLDITDEVEVLALSLLASRIVPKKASEDAIHIAVATVHGMDYLLTWNCRHIANAEIRQQLADTVLERGYLLPVICTPEELGGE